MIYPLTGLRREMTHLVDYWAKLDFWGDYWLLLCRAEACHSCEHLASSQLWQSWLWSFETSLSRSDSLCHTEKVSGGTVSNMFVVLYFLNCGRISSLGGRRERCCGMHYLGLPTRLYEPVLVFQTNYLVFPIVGSIWWQWQSHCFKTWSCSQIVAC